MGEQALASSGCLGAVGVLLHCFLVQTLVDRFFVEGVSLGFCDLALILHDLFAAGANGRDVLL